MEIFIICLVAFLASILTFFSGFGLGTILAPVLALFFPIDIAIALTGVVHFANNLFKIVLVGRNADRGVLLRFGIPAIIASFAGAWLLLRITVMPAVYEYEYAGRSFEITPVKLIIALILIFFSAVELSPAANRISIRKSMLWLGGLLSGFFGGLSGIQGAIRSAFLLKSGLSKEGYIATGVVIACFIDFTRLSVYASRFSASGLNDNVPLLLAAILSAMAGALIGKRLLKKITYRSIQLLVAIMLIIISLGLGSGLI
jgi:uncharacterized protein